MKDQLISLGSLYSIPTLFPVPYSAVLIYTYYHGIIDHSGINFKRKFWQPWQPDCIFHDNHHQYFHVNFGFNIEFWDKVRWHPILIVEGEMWGRGIK